MENERVDKIIQLEEENAGLKVRNKTLKEKVHWWKKEVRVAQKAREDAFEALTIENKVLERELKAEKEYNATLRKDIDDYTNSHTLCVKYKELEKENADLKKIKRDCETSICRAEYQWMYTKFAAAKGIIKELLESCFGYNSKTVNYEIKARAEEFLKEMEK